MGFTQRRTGVSKVAAFAVGVVAFVVALLAGAVAEAKKAPPGAIKVALAQLHPTQGAVGMREVAVKQAKVAELTRLPAKLDKYLAKHAIPAVLGPGGVYYIIDHHHLGLALLRAGVTESYVTVAEDLSGLDTGAFFKTMEETGRLHPFDEAGHRIEPSALPQTLPALRDDPYRDLAGAVRDAGGYAKTTAPYSEFSWADFLRMRVAPELIAADYPGAVSKGVELAKSRDASALPGYLGPN